ncbi:hypothetical protein [Streptomyces boluensis]|uniref:hypothetical protein n=1 Tax=Streptomyces boluensis TaxID=1775135 RepID=UPI001FEA8470|nr:hypothetical protein [Streptomyces boluensis]
MDEKEGAGRTGTKLKRKKIELNVPQVAGSAVAAVVAAKMASSFGVYGTILGAGLVSVIATCGGSIFQHFFSRTGEQVREAAEKAKPRARQVPVTADGRPVPETFRGSAAPKTGPVTTSWRPGVVTAEGDAKTALPAAAGAADDAARTQLVTAADADRTQLLTSVDLPDPASEDAAADDRTELLATVDDDRTQLLTTVAGDRTRLLTPVGAGAAGPADATRALPRAEETMLLRADGAGTPPADTETRLLGGAKLPLDGVPEAYGESVVQGKRVKSWKRPLLGAALVFGVTMAGIASYELVSGDSFSGNDSRVLQPGSWSGSGSGSGEQRQDDPERSPSRTTPTEGGTPGADRLTPGTGPTATPGGDSGTKPQPTPTPSRSAEQPTPTPSASESDEPTTDPSSPSPSDEGEAGDGDGAQERGVTPTG